MADINPLSSHDAGNAFADLIGDDLLVDTGADDAPADASDEPRGDAALASEAAQDAPAAAPEASDDEDEPEAGADKDEPEDASDEDEAQPASTGEMFAVVIDGQTHQVPKDEVIRGYQRQADYSRKTAALADERKAIGTERGQYGQLLGALHQRVSELMPQEPNWQALQADPAQYVAAQEMWRQKTAAEAELNRLDAEDQHRDNAYRAQRVEEGQRWLIQQQPEWQDPEVRQRDFAAVLGHARELGYTDEELAHADDPRALLAMHQAAEYRRLMAGAENVKRSAVKKGAKVLKAGGATSLADGSSRKSKQANMAKLRTGNLADAGNILAGFLPDDLS